MSTSPEDIKKQNEEENKKKPQGAVSAPDVSNLQPSTDAPANESEENNKASSPAPTADKMQAGQGKKTQDEDQLSQKSDLKDSAAATHMDTLNELKDMANSNGLQKTADVIKGTFNSVTEGVKNVGDLAQSAGDKIKNTTHKNRSLADTGGKNPEQDAGRKQVMEDSKVNDKPHPGKGTAPEKKKDDPVLEQPASTTPRSGAASGPEAAAYDSGVSSMTPGNQNQDQNDLNKTPLQPNKP